MNTDQSVYRNAPLVRVTNVSKSFGGAIALRDVSLDIRGAAVHGLVGANGAGKSTLIKCLAGVIHPDSGEIAVDGRQVDIRVADDAAGLGLAFIHQEMSLIPGWDVLRNLALGTDVRTRAGVIDWRPTRERAAEVVDRLGITFSLKADIDSLSTADKWLVLIGRALMRDARMIAMDEPTASLSYQEAQRLHEIIRELTGTGTAVVFVSHRLDEVSSLCDDITVFKDGMVTMQRIEQRVSKPELVTAIVGRELEILDHGHPAEEHGRPILELRDICDARILDHVSLTVHAGEIVGLGGLVGSGRTELAKIAYGAGVATSGQVVLDGQTRHFKHPSQAVAAGIGFVPEERRSEGVILDRSIDFNINLASFDSMRLHRFLPLLNKRLGRARAQTVADQVTVKAKDVTSLVGSLSGGNQQKVVIARWLVQTPKMLILDEPSRGVDVGSRAEVHQVIRELARQGTAVLVISSDNEELVALCDRVVVMSEGHVSGQIVGEAITENRIIALSFHRDPEGELAS